MHQSIIQIMENHLFRKFYENRYFCFLSNLCMNSCFPLNQSMTLMSGLFKKSEEEMFQRMCSELDVPLRWRPLVMPTWWCLAYRCEMGSSMPGRWPACRWLCWKLSRASGFDTELTSSSAYASAFTVVCVCVN